MNKVFCFRPLTGINFNAKDWVNCEGDRIVSVPSRG